MNEPQDVSFTIVLAARAKTKDKHLDKLVTALHSIFVDVADIVRATATYDHDGPDSAPRLLLPFEPVDTAVCACVRVRNCWPSG